MLGTVLLALATATFQPVTPATSAQTVQVYVRDPAAQAQPGPDGHDYGLRPPNERDGDATPLYNAHGNSVKALLGVWRTADGTATFDPARDGVRVRAVFRGLVPNARYSLFVRQLAGRTGTVFTPLDVTGMQNNFTSDELGRGEIVLVSPLQLAPGAQLALIYHSDGVDHQSSIGNPGVTSHVQLLTRVP